MERRDLLTLTLAVNDIAATEGTAFHGTLAALVDSVTTETSADFVATIDWGDGIHSAGQVLPDASGFDITGSHSFAEESPAGSPYVVTVNVVDVNGGSARGSGSASVSDATLGGAIGSPIAAAQNVPFLGTVASFVDSNPLATAADFANSGTTISWGDGATSPGQVTNNGHGGFDVVGAHTYTSVTASTPFTTTVLIADRGGATASAPGAATVTPTAAVPQYKITALPVAVAAAQTFSGPVATFTDTDQSDMSGRFTAQVDWGDGQVSIGAVTGNNGAFAVSATHVYAAPGSFRLTVTGFDQAGKIFSGTSQADVGTPPPPVASIVKLTSLPIAVAAGQPFTGPVAIVTDSNTNDAAGQFAATIDWGDGHVTQGAVSGQNSVFAVGGTYSYPLPGTYVVTVRLIAPVGQVLSGTSQAVIGSPIPSTASIPFTIALAPLPANGPNASRGLAITGRPIFNGSAPPFSIVLLTANRIDIDAPLSLGRAVADGSGVWNLSTGPLADGIYNIIATVTPPGGAPERVTNPPNSGNSLDQFIIDTAPPRVVAVQPLGQSGKVLVSLRAGLSGMDPATLLDPANYTFQGDRGLSFHPASVTARSIVKAPGEFPTVVLTMGTMSKARHRVHNLSLNASRITSRAGSPLEVTLPATTRFSLSPPPSGTEVGSHATRSRGR